MIRSVRKRKSRSSLGRKVCVVIPTRNEQATIGAVIRDASDCIRKLDYNLVKVIVVDDSRDNTRAIAAKSGAEVINGGGRGLGWAMFKGLKKASTHDCDIIVAMDSDGQSDAKELEHFLKPIDSGEADMVLGSRFLGTGLVKYRYRFINRFGIRVLVFILRRLTGLKLTDSHGGLRAMRKEVAQELEMLGTHTYVQETIIDAVEKGFRVKEVPSIWLEREEGTSRVVGSIPTYVFYTLPILILRAKRHLNYLYSLGIMLVFAAIAYFGYLLWTVNFNVKLLFDRLPSFLLIALMIMTGIQLFFFGVVLQLIKDLKYQAKGFN